MASVGNESGDNKNFDLNLVPFIDILSTCICFLLMTTIWIHIGSFDVSQALGDQVQDNKNPPSVVVQIGDNGNLDLHLKDVPKPKGPTTASLSASSGNVDLQALKDYVARLRNRVPDLKTALVMPSEHVKYDDVIRVMDTFRTQQITQIGLAPVGGN